MDFIEHWNEELRKMNQNKRGSPFTFPQSFIEYAAFVKTSFDLTYRGIQGFLRGLSRYMRGLQSAYYTTLWRRIRATEFEMKQLESCPLESIYDFSVGKGRNFGHFFKSLKQ